MNILLISQCHKNALKETRRILDQFAERCGERCWQTQITSAGLQTLHRLLRASARKNTAVACHWIHGKNHSELLWIVGDRRQFNRQGAVPTERSQRKVLSLLSETRWKDAASIQIIATIAALCHDLGKASQGFQRKLRGEGKNADPLRHEWLSLKLFCAMIQGCASDEAWLKRLHDWETYRQAQPNWHQINTKDVLLSGDFSALPPLAKWVAWLIASHHRLPFYDTEYSDERKMMRSTREDALFLQTPQAFFADFQPAKHWVRHVEEHEIKYDFFHLQADPSAEKDWQALMRKWTSKALNHAPLFALTETALLSNPLLLHLSRAALMSADHHYSSLPRQTEEALSADALLANTDHQRQARQSLNEHLCGVAKKAAHFAHLLPHFAQELPTLSHHKAFKKATKIPRFQWQNQACQLAQQLQSQSQEQGFFGVNLASTGCGKTLGNARILYALADPTLGARITIAMGLRVLTLQTGQALRERLALQENDSIATLVGGSIIQDLEALNTASQSQETGSESLESLLAAQEVLDIGEVQAGIIDMSAQFGALVQDKKAQRLLETPIVSCTVDHLMQISEQLRGGRYIIPLLRLLSSDLILDEPDDFSAEDLPALQRLVYWAGLLGSRLLLSSATLTPDMTIGLYRAYQDGRNHWNALQGLPQRPVISAWFDEFEQHSGSYNEEDFAIQHNAFCERRCERLAAQAVRRRAEILPITSKDPSAIAQTLLDCADKFHQQHHQVDPHHHKRLSIGLIRFANINPMMRVAQALFSAQIPENTCIHLVCYHSQQILLLRSRLEQKLDKILNRSDENAIFQHNEIQSALQQSEAQNHIVIVLGTSVTEVGRDHDYDWAIIEPSSMRSIIQLAGRVWRHRPEKIAESANIAIMQKNIKALENRRIAFEHPGFESIDYPLASHDITDLINQETLAHINSISRLRAPTPSAAPKPAFRRGNLKTAEKNLHNLSQLEHQVMRELLNSKTNFVYHYRQENAAMLSAHHALISPFRAGRAQTDYIAFPVEDEARYHIKRIENAYRYGADDSNHENDQFIYAPLPDAAHIHLWLNSALEQALQEIAPLKNEDNIEALALRYAQLRLPADNRKDKHIWYYNEWGGFWQEKED